MVLNQMDNKALKQDLIDDLRLNVAYDAIPSTVIPSIQPVAIVEKKYCDIVRRGIAINSTSATVYGTPTDKDFYLTFANLSFIKDASSTAVTMTLTVVIEGVSINLLELNGFSTIADSDATSGSFHPAIKIDRGTNIIVTSNTSASNIRVSGNIAGYTSSTLSA